MHSDFTFAKANADEFGNRQAPLLRYVAAINPAATKKQFIVAAVAEGYNPNTAAIQFAESRKLSVSLGDVKMLPDGHLIEL